MAGKVLIVDDVATNRIVLKVKLSGARYETIQAGTGAQALRLVAQESPDLILLDVQLPDMSGIDVCRRLKSDPATAHLPVIVVTAFPTPEIRLEALRSGADDFITKPFEELTLLARLRSLMRMRETDEELRMRENTCHELGFAEAPPAEFEQPARIGLVARDRETCVAWKNAMLRYLPNDLLRVLDYQTALSAAAESPPPDAYVIAADLARPGEGLRLMSELRSRAGSRHSVICVAVRDAARETSAVALDLGASDLTPAGLAEPAFAEEAALRLTAHIARKRRHDRQRERVADGLRLALVDPLTGLYNRRYAMPHVTRLAERSRLSGRNFAVMVLDLDRFKSVNDTYGHAAGDAVLIEVARRLSANLRQVDLVARVGGEEFLVAMPECTLEGARIVAERLCRVMEERPFDLPGGVTLDLTVSIGLALGGGGSENTSIDQVIHEADYALMGSKAEGRNQVTIFQRGAA
ncbi:response regulator receiver modulated diguanylate cyclase [Rhodobacter aestuarii]|uniref:diguanylate cyclase n=1 Tax=Rhodobacter aestuarii TaxID=453582 RepID=A0A1N7MMA1_9RHOB|nr:MULTISPECIES: diguanylate cyclase [Rhodobacter]PTV96662.1 response regulator receiver modulated diguanylate cyclase [Rhodobacter aestuarii]SIS87223.1 response regulator receiver modulated diguanylate cyclase [Rhodobacter aestuarii]SOB90952.1 response regulator receiver modulated diguanylate cyclase [Rhodobacter sp. JA431]